MMRSKRRAALAISLCAVILMAVILPAVALASSYYSSLEVTGGRTWNGPNRSYNGTHMHISCNTYSAGSKSYVVILYRNHTWPIPDDKIGSMNMPRNGYASKVWTNVGSGAYHFKFDNKSSSYTIYCDHNQVHIWSSN